MRLYAGNTDGPKNGMDGSTRELMDTRTRSVGIKIDTAANEAKNESECVNESADLKLTQCARNWDTQAHEWMEKGKHRQC